MIGMKVSIISRITLSTKEKSNDLKGMMNGNIKEIEDENHDSLR